MDRARKLTLGLPTSSSAVWHERVLGGSVPVPSRPGGGSCLSDRRAEIMVAASTLGHNTAKAQPWPVRRDGFAKPGDPRPLLAAEGALIQHDTPFPSLFLPDQDTPIVIRE